jgi:hypothetical protein
LRVRLAAEGLRRASRFGKETTFANVEDVLARAAI